MCRNFCITYFGTGICILDSSSQSISFIFQLVINSHMHVIFFKKKPAQKQSRSAYLLRFIKIVFIWCYITYNHAEIGEFCGILSPQICTWGTQGVRILVNWKPDATANSMLHKSTRRKKNNETQKNGNSTLEIRLYNLKLQNSGSNSNEKYSGSTLSTSSKSSISA